MEAPGLPTIVGSAFGNGMRSFDEPRVSLHSHKDVGDCKSGKADMRLTLIDRLLESVESVFNRPSLRWSLGDIHSFKLRFMASLRFSSELRLIVSLRGSRRKEVNLASMRIIFPSAKKSADLHCLPHFDEKDAPQS